MSPQNLIAVATADSVVGPLNQIELAAANQTCVSLGLIPKAAAHGGKPGIGGSPCVIAGLIIQPARHCGVGIGDHVVEPAENAGPDHVQRHGGEGSTHEEIQRGGAGLHGHQNWVVVVVGRGAVGKAQVRVCCRGQPVYPPVVHQCGLIDFLETERGAGRPGAAAVDADLAVLVLNDQVIVDQCVGIDPDVLAYQVKGRQWSRLADSYAALTDIQQRHAAQAP